jgi:predicted O-methyltransferase YrrM
MDKLIEKYIYEHSSSEDPLLDDLYRKTHIKFVNPNMSAGHMQGKLLEFISAMVNPENILEIGTYTGYSAICLARGLKPGGKLLTIEMNDEFKRICLSYFKKAGLGSEIIQLTDTHRRSFPVWIKLSILSILTGTKGNTQSISIRKKENKTQWIYFSR